MPRLLNYRVQLIAIILFSFLACTDQDQSNDQETADTSAMARTTTADKPAFDTSRSVTVISPALYKKLGDTLNIRILEGTYKPGDSSIIHAHPDFALYVLQGGAVELTANDGTKQKIEFKKGMAAVLPAATHSAKNIGKTTVKLVVVEVNRPRD